MVKDDKEVQLENAYFLISTTLLGNLISFKLKQLPKLQQPIEVTEDGIINVFNC